MLMDVVVIFVLVLEALLDKLEPMFTATPAGSALKHTLDRLDIF